MEIIEQQCPTRDDKIACSECPHECKLRMELIEQMSTEIPPESLPVVIYY